MLFDRFDNMRSKVINGGGGSEYDYDLSQIGITVSAQAQSTVSKGQRWEGVENASVDYAMSFKAFSNPLSTSFATSKHCEVGVLTNASITSATTTLPVYFINKLTNSYDTVNVNITTAIQALELNVLESNSISYTPSISINDEGTLAKIAVRANTQISWAGSQKFIVIEIDKANKTGTAYVQTISFIPNYLNADLHALIGDYFIIESTSGSNANCFKYDKSTHLLTSLGSIYDYYLQYFWSGQIVGAWVSSNKVIIQIGVDVKLIAFTFYEDSVIVQSYYSSPLGSSQNYYMSGDGKYIANQHGNELRVGLINPNDLSVTSYVTLTSISISEFLIHGDLIMAYTGGTIKLYEIKPNEIALIKSLSNKPYFVSRRTSIFYDFTKDTFYRDSSHPELWKLNVIDAEFIISPSNGNTTSNKYYGIASKTIETGEQDNAQLLFNTVTTP